MSFIVLMSFILSTFCQMGYAGYVSGSTYGRGYYPNQRPGYSDKFEKPVFTVEGIDNIIEAQVNGEYSQLMPITPIKTLQIPDQTLKAVFDKTILQPDNLRKARLKNGYVYNKHGEIIGTYKDHNEEKLDLGTIRSKLCAKNPQINKALYSTGFPDIYGDVTGLRIARIKGKAFDGEDTFVVFFKHAIGGQSNLQCAAGVFSQGEWETLPETTAVAEIQKSREAENKNTNVFIRIWNGIKSAFTTFLSWFGIEIKTDSDSSAITSPDVNTVSKPKIKDAAVVTKEMYLQRQQINRQNRSLSKAGGSYGPTPIGGEYNSIKVNNLEQLKNKDIPEKPIDPQASRIKQEEQREKIQEQKNRDRKDAINQNSEMPKDSSYKMPDIKYDIDDVTRIDIRDNIKKANVKLAELGYGEFQLIPTPLDGIFKNDRPSKTMKIFTRGMDRIKQEEKSAESVLGTKLRKMVKDNAYLANVKFKNNRQYEAQQIVKAIGKEQFQLSKRASKLKTALARVKTLKTTLSVLTKQMKAVENKKKITAADGEKITAYQYRIVRTLGNLEITFDSIDKRSFKTPKDALDTKTLDFARRYQTVDKNLDMGSLCTLYQANMEYPGAAKLEQKYVKARNEAQSTGNQMAALHLEFEKEEKGKNRAVVLGAIQQRIDPIQKKYDALLDKEMALRDKQTIPWVKERINKNIPNLSSAELEKLAASYDTETQKARKELGSLELKIQQGNELKSAIRTDLIDLNKKQARSRKADQVLSILRPVITELENKKM